MSQAESIPLGPQSPAGTGEHNLRAMSSAEDLPPMTDQSQQQRPHSLDLRRVAVLIGNGLLQLPIWGKLRPYWDFYMYYSLTTSWVSR